MSGNDHQTWILTGSLENFRINVERGFDPIGFKERRRRQAEPVLILPEEEFVPAEELATELEHVRKWPPDHWHLAFQGQLRTISESDAALLRERLSSKTAARA